MGRELRRVPLNFSWPLNKTWSGFLNPHGKPCTESQKTCFRGRTADAQWLDAFTRVMIVAADDARERGRHQYQTPHPYLAEMPTAPTYDIPPNTPREDLPRIFAERSRNHAQYVIPPTKALAALFCALLPKDRQPDPDNSPFGGLMGTSAGWYIQKAIFAAAGVDPETWGVCPVCKGEDLDPAVREAYEAWTETPVPEGPGYQLWETVSEGSPVSPVFPTEEAFIQYLVSEGSTRSAAESFAKSGWTPSMVIVNGKMATGIEVAEAMEGK